MTTKKHIIAYYPSFERGGITNNLINFLNECSKLNIQNSLITEKLKWKKNYQLSKKTKLYTLVNKNYLFLSKRVSSSLFSSLFLLKILTSYKKKELILISFQSHIIPIIICKFLGIKIIIRNSEEIFGATKYSENVFFSFLILILKILFYNFSDGLIVNSSESKKSINKIIFDSKKTKLIFNPYLNKIINVKKKRKKDILLSIGRLCKQKDYPTLLKGFKLFLRRNKNYRLIILGHGPDLKQLKKLALELKINKNVEFKGWVSNTKNYLKKAKIFVLPSLYEGSPNSLIDAVNFEIPTISTKCSGAEDILTLKNGNFFSFQNYQELSKKINEIDKDYKKNLLKIRNSKQKISRFFAKNQVKEYIKFINKL